MSRHYPPASLRYLKARLWNLARPSFWGTAIFLAVVGMGIYEYWTNPDFLKWQQTSVNSSTLEESSSVDADESILPDADNLPVLLNDRAKINSPSIAPITIPKSSKGDNNGLLNNLNKVSTNLPNQAKSQPGVVSKNPVYNLQIENPFLTQAENLLKGNNSQTHKNFLGVNSPSENYLNPQVTPQVTTTPILTGGYSYGKTSTSLNIPTTSPVQTAINKSIQPYQTNGVTSEKSGNNFSPNSSFNQPGINNSSGVTSVTSYTQPLQINQQPNTSNISPGYTQPGLTNPQLNQSNNLYNQQFNNQQFNQGYSQPQPTINLNPTQQSSTVPINSGLQQQQQTPTQPLSQVTSPSTNYSLPTANQGVPQPNNYDNTVWEQLIERSQYNQIQPQSSSNN